jgi:hypothetical protein
MISCNHLFSRNLCNFAHLPVTISSSDLGNCFGDKGYAYQCLRESILARGLLL